MKSNVSFAFIIVLVQAGHNFACAQSDSEKYNSGWQFNMDNNLLQRKVKDLDYTAGIAFTASGSRAQSGWLNIDPLRAWLFDKIPVGSKTNTALKKHSVQYGFVLFTPEDISATQPILNDRPFASLFYISNTELTVQAAKNRAYRSSLSLGLLGLDIAGSIQSILHETIKSDDANGWDNQISAGGEPTALLTLSVQHNHSRADSYQTTTHLEGNIGYSTDINAGINWRWGRLNTPWWSFNPSHYEYIASSASSVRGVSSSKPEFYFYAGANIKYRFYSSLLQGQFRDSAHTLGRSQIEQAIASATVGTTREFGDNLRFSLFVRGTTAEIKGPNARNLWWLGIVVNRAW